MNKTISSVVVFLDDEVPFVIAEEGLRTKLRGRNLPVDRYDFGPGRKKTVTEDVGSWA